MFIQEALRVPPPEKFSYSNYFKEYSLLYIGSMQ